MGRKKKKEKKRLVYITDGWCKKGKSFREGGRKENFILRFRSPGRGGDLLKNSNSSQGMAFLDGWGREGKSPRTGNL